MAKSPAMIALLDAISQKKFGRKYSDSVGSGMCVMCGKQATAFRNEISNREFQISGMCQKCQDKTFGTDPD